MRLSLKFIERLKLAHEPAYRLALKAKIRPDVLSKYTTGYFAPRAGDERLIRLGALLGLQPTEVFEE